MTTLSHYPPSIVDRFMAWADELPGPVWLFYLMLLSLLIIVVNGITWVDGSATFGTIDRYRSSVPVYPVASLALIHYLNRVARRALNAFRPALNVEDEAYKQIEYELIILPWGRTWVVLIMSLIFTTLFILNTPNHDVILSPLPWLALVDLVIYALVFGLIAVFVYHTLRQLSLVSRIHASAPNINLFQPIPLYAFSRLSAQTGVGLLLLNSFSILTDQTTFVNPALNALTIFTSLVAVACFILPMRGIHDRIVAEKRRLFAEANTRLEGAIQELYRRADSHNLSGIDQLNQLITSLIVTRTEVAKLPTWPWDAGTLTGFVSAFILPLIFRLIGLFTV